MRRARSTVGSAKTCRRAAMTLDAAPELFDIGRMLFLGRQRTPAGLTLETPAMSPDLIQVDQDPKTVTTNFLFSL
jgi:hypothetical protein